jgi:hypothetical protein
MPLLSDINGSGAVEDTAGDGSNNVPFAFLSVLVLPTDVAAELEAWASQQQITLGELTPVVQDMAFVIDTIDALQLGAIAAPEAPGDTTGSDEAVDAENLAGLADLAAKAAESLLDFFRMCSLLAAEDLVVVLRQQLLVASRRLRPLAAGALPLPEEAAAAGNAAAAAVSNVLAVPVGNTAAANHELPAEEAREAAAGGSVTTSRHLCPDATNGGVKKGTSAGASEEGKPSMGLEVTPASKEAAGTSSMCTDTSRGSSSSKSGSEEAARSYSRSSSSASSWKGGSETASLSSALSISTADSYAAAAGGSKGFLLCWHGFQGQDVELQYLIFKAKYSRFTDWGAKGLFAVLMAGFMLKYLQMVQWQVWPPYKIFGECTGPCCVSYT